MNEFNICETYETLKLISLLHIYLSTNGKIKINQTCNIKLNYNTGIYPDTLFQQVKSMSCAVITDIVHRPSAFLALLGLLSLCQGVFYVVLSHVFMTYTPRDPLFILGINATLIGITLIIIAKICFKDVNFGSQNKRRHLLEETLLKKLGTTSRSDDDQSFEVIQPTNTNKKEWHYLLVPSCIIKSNL